MSRCEIIVRPTGPDACPHLTVAIQWWNFAADDLKALKESIPFLDEAGVQRRHYDEEEHTWYVGLKDLGFVTTLALRFDEARLVQGNTITLLHSGRVLEQGVLFAEEPEV